MITLKSESELLVMERCNEIVLEILSELGDLIYPGVNVLDLDRYAEEQTRRAGAIPSFKGYKGFPAALCVSINEQVVHGIPAQRQLKEGDLVSLDFGVFFEEFHGDAAQTFAVGKVPPGHARLVADTREALRHGILEMGPGKRLGDVGHAVQSFAESRGWSVVRDFVGHGIGRELHERPSLPNYGRPGTGLRMEEGMVLAVEPMLNMGGPAVTTGKDNWTVSTQDGMPSAHFERSVAITGSGPWVLGTGGRPGEVNLSLPGVSARTSAV
ncbi:MAG: type I methionyl aminopeptidase [Acidobacteriota bacterium]